MGGRMEYTDCQLSRLLFGGDGTIGRVAEGEGGRVLKSSEWYYQEGEGTEEIQSAFEGKDKIQCAVYVVGYYTHFRIRYSPGRKTGPSSSIVHFPQKCQEQKERQEL
jgi:hypothetical protein